jgi:excisionase family DNA binding protein
MEPERWLTKKEAAALARVSPKTIDRAIRRGWLRRVQNGVRKVLISETEISRWMNGSRIAGLD